MTDNELDMLEEIIYSPSYWNWECSSIDKDDCIERAIQILESNGRTLPQDIQERRKTHPDFRP